MIVEIREDSDSVAVITEKNGRKFRKEITVDSFIEGVIAAKSIKKTDFEPIFGEMYIKKRDMELIQTIQTSESGYIYIIKKEASKMPLAFSKEVFYEEIGFPSLLFAIKTFNNRFIAVYVVAIKSGIDVNNDTDLYCYPFSNVSNNTSSSNRMCIGANRIDLNYKNRNNLFNTIDFIFSMPNNMDYYNKNNNSKKLDFGELCAYLNNKSFEDSLLVSRNMKYNQWIKNVIEKF